MGVKQLFDALPHGSVTLAGFFEAPGPLGRVILFQGGNENGTLVHGWFLCWLLTISSHSFMRRFCVDHANYFP
jgi:hypothetical protein